MLALASVGLIVSDAAAGNFRVRDLSLPYGVDHERFKRRQSMLEAVDGDCGELEQSKAL